TPMQWTKQVASHFGGTSNGMVISWPARIKDKGGLRSQFCHVIDVVPTIYEAIGITPPKVLDGVEQKPLEGVSLEYTFDNANAPIQHTTQYFELVGNRGIYKDGWMASTTPLRLPWVTAGFEPNPDDFKWEQGLLVVYKSRSLYGGYHSSGYRSGASGACRKRCNA